MPIVDMDISGDGEQDFTASNFLTMHVEITALPNPDTGVFGTISPQRLVRAGWLGLGFTLSEFITEQKVVFLSVLIDATHQAWHVQPESWNMDFIRWILPSGVTAHLWIEN